MSLNKHQNIESLLSIIKQWREESQTIVFTNGCFDILHKGHIEYLTKAASLGDKLVVGLNSDASIKLQDKGVNRPLQDESSRVTVMCALEMVDAVIIFEEETPELLIKTILPDMLVKGGDWKPEEIVGSNIVLENGGKVKSVSFVPGYSTSAIEDKIKRGG